MSSEPSNPPPAPDGPPWPEESGIWATYSLHCHCGAIRYTMKISPPLYESQSQGKGIWRVNECNCSWCERNGVQSIHPLSENVKYTKGEENLTRYSFGNKNVTHLICKTCGSFVGSDAEEMFRKRGMEPRCVVNARMLKDYDPSKLTFVKREYMKHVPPVYSVGDEE